MTPAQLVSRCSQLLQDAWHEIEAAAARGSLSDVITDPQVIDSVQRCMNSTVKSYRYVLPTQLVAKLADPSLDCRCLQAARGGPGAFDARTVAHKVVVPFDRANHSVLGGSPEPYVNNPLRVPEVSPAFRAPQKDKSTWDDLCCLLDGVEAAANTAYTRDLLRQTLLALYRRLGQTPVTYPAPRRISLEATLHLIDEFLSQRSGGERFECVTAALFQALGDTFGLFQRIERSKVTTADTSAGLLADVQCVDAEGKIVWLVEAKDQELTIRQLQDKLPGIRAKAVAEAFFLTASLPANHELGTVDQLIRHEFISGHNIYTMDLRSFSRVSLALLGEAGRRRFLQLVGAQLDQYSDFHHRRAWAEALSGL
jgi:hypothetical protein